MNIKEINYIIGESLEDYNLFMLYDHTHDKYIGTFDDPETAIMVANTIKPYGCDRIDVEAAYDTISGSLPFYLRDIKNDYTKFSARIALFEVYDDARKEYELVEKFATRPGQTFEDTLAFNMGMYEGGKYED